MQNGAYDVTTPRTDERSLLTQIAAALSSSVEEEVPLQTPITDIGHILIHLSEAVVQAQDEAERERNLRIALELENEAMRVRHDRSHRFSSPCIDTSALYSSDFSGSAPVISVDHSLLDSSLTLSECLSFLSSLSRPEFLYMSYFNSGFEGLIASSVERIYKPCDFANLMFVIFKPTVGVVPAGLIPFSLDGLQTLLASSVSTPVDISGASAVDDSSDEPPRMNLLEALNVQRDDDCSRIVTVRKCHKLGFKSHIHLRQYFSRFGRVDRVVLLPMRAKPKHATDGRGNRPSSMGFVVMETKEGADRILGYNNFCGIHEVRGWPIEVRNFVKPADKPIDRDISGASTGIASDLTAW